MSKILKKEIERKFLVETPITNLNEYSSQMIYQCYLNSYSDSIELRARCIDEKEFYMNIKDMGNKSRNEITIPITQDQFDVFWTVSTPKHIEKRRYFIPSSDGKYTIEYDVFEENLKGLVLCEVECETEELVDDFVKESWIGKEVTDYDEYKNRTLALKGLPVEEEKLPFDELRKLEKIKKLDI